MKNFLSMSQFIIRKLIIVFTFFVLFIGASNFGNLRELKSNSLIWGLSAMQGRRPTMEDTHIHISKISSTINGSLFGIFDGHGGPAAALIASKYFYELFEANISLCNSDYEKALEKTFVELEDKILPFTDSGSTALLTFIYDKNAYIAWVGDSRAIIIRDGKIIFATIDHKPDLHNEKKRIEGCGGQVVKFGVPRVNGLAVSRTLGDKELKLIKPGAIIATPEIQRIDILKGDILVLACDGLWDVMSNQEVARFIIEEFKEPKFTNSGSHNIKNHAKGIHFIDGSSEKLKKISSALAEQAYVKLGSDNISVLIVQI